MTKQQLTEILRPLIKKCIQEELSSSNGVLKKVITEIADGLASKQLNLVLETIRAVQPQRTMISESQGLEGPSENKSPSMHKMIRNSRELIGIDEDSQNAYVDVEKKFSKMDPNLRGLLEETQQKVAPQEMQAAEWEPPPPIEKIIGPDGKIDPKHAGSLGPLRDIHPDDPGIDLGVLSNIIKKKKQ